MSAQFEYNSESHSDLHRTLSSLVKFNNGFFKSKKQAQFILTNKKWEDCTWLNIDWNSFSIDVPKGTKVFNTSGMTAWASYGAKSLRPVTWVWVLDKFGVVGQYKLGYKGDMRSGTAADSEKTKKIFERDSTLNKPQFEEDEEKEVSTSKWVGTLGQRLEFEALVAEVRTFTSGPYEGVTITTLSDGDGNLFNLWGEIASPGEKIRIRATVKKHTEFRGVKQTTVNRPKILEVL